MAIADGTKLVDIDGEEDILEALAILAGAALMQGNRRLYEHVYRAKVQYGQGVDLRLTDSPSLNGGGPREDGPANGGPSA